MKRKECEFCNKRFVSADSTICQKCDTKLEMQQTREAEARALKHAKKYRCERCNVGLPETRRRICEICSPSELRSHYETQMYSFSLKGSKAWFA